MKNDRVHSSEKGTLANYFFQCITFDVEQVRELLKTNPINQRDETGHTANGSIRHGPVFG